MWICAVFVHCPTSCLGLGKCALCFVEALKPRLTPIDNRNPIPIFAPSGTDGTARATTSAATTATATAPPQAALLPREVPLPSPHQPSKKLRYETSLSVFFCCSLFLTRDWGNRPIWMRVSSVESTNVIGAMER